jgi:hypothetical protein
MMRTTLNLPDDVLRAARSLADAKGVSLGDALAELVRAGLKPRVHVNTKNAFPCFVAKDGARPITLEQTLEGQDEDL